MGSDRALILARRRVFIASALAGLTAACDRRADVSPEPTASVADPQPAAPSPALVPEFSAEVGEDAAPPEASAAPRATVAPAPKVSAPRPRPCLSVGPPKPPAHCNPPYYLDAKGIKRIKPGCY